VRRRSLWRAYISDRTSIVRRSLHIFWQTFGHRRCPGLMYCNRYYGPRSVQCLFVHLGGGLDLAYPKSCTRWYTLLERRFSLHGCQTLWLTRWEMLKTLVALQIRTATGFISLPRDFIARLESTPIGSLPIFRWSQPSGFAVLSSSYSTQPLRVGYVKHRIDVLPS